MARLDQGVEVDAGFDAEFSGHQRQLFGGDIARCTGLLGERTAAQTADGGVEPGYAEPHAAVGIGDPQPARIVQVQRDLQIGKAFAHRADGALDQHRVGPAHGVAQCHAAQHVAAIASQFYAVLYRRDDLGRCHVAGEIAAKCGHQRDLLDDDTGGAVIAQILRDGGEVAGAVAIEVADREGLGGGEVD